MRPAADETAARFAGRLGIETGSLRQAGGASGSAWLVGGPPLVVRIGPVDRMRREAAAHAAAGDTVPVPRVLDLVEDERLAALLIDVAAGRPALDAARDAPSLARRIGAACGALHDRIAAVPAPVDMPADGSIGRLLHLDLHPMNVLVDERGGVTAVLDWANAAAGDPVRDRARTWSILMLDPDARALVVHPWWRDLLDGWRSAGRLDDLGPADRAWACRFLLRDLAGRHEPGALRPARSALRLAEREISPP